MLIKIIPRNDDLLKVICKSLQRQKTKGEKKTVLILL